MIQHKKEKMSKNPSESQHLKNPEPKPLYQWSSSLELTPMQKEYIQSLNQQNKQKNTIKNYRVDLNIFNQFLLEKSQLKLSSIDHIQLSSQKIKEYEHFLDKRYGSSNSKRRRIQTLRLYVDFLISKGIVASNIIREMIPQKKRVHQPRPYKSEHIIPYFDYLIEQLSSAKSNLEQLTHLRNLVIFSLVYDSALKVSHLETLKLGDLDIDSSLKITLYPAKRDPYTVDINPNATALYKTYIKKYIQYAQEKNKELQQSDGLLFSANAHTILRSKVSARGLEMIFHKIIPPQIQERLTLKSLREACILRWCHQKIPDHDIKHSMGVQPQYDLKRYYQELENNDSYGLFPPLPYEKLATTFLDE